MSADFVKVAETKDIQPSTMKAIDLAGERVCVGNVVNHHHKFSRDVGHYCTTLDLCPLMI